MPSLKWNLNLSLRYVSLGKVESVLKGCPVVGNVCVYGDSSKSYVVAVICPIPATLKEIADKFGKSDMGFEAQCKDKDITGAVLREVLFIHNNFELQFLPGCQPCEEQQAGEVWDSRSSNSHSSWVDSGEDFEAACEIQSNQFSGHWSHYGGHEAEKKTAARILQGRLGQDVRQLKQSVLSCFSKLWLFWQFIITTTTADYLLVFPVTQQRCRG